MKEVQFYFNFTITNTNEPECRGNKLLIVRRVESWHFALVVARRSRFRHTLPVLGPNRLMHLPRVRIQDGIYRYSLWVVLRTVVYSKKLVL